MITAPPITPLTEPQKRVAAPLVYGGSNESIAAQIQLSADGVASQLRVARKKLGRPGCSRAVLVHALLTTRQVAPPVCHRPPPAFTEDELGLLRALSEHSLNEDIGHAIGVRASDVRAELDALLAKACADNAAHLVGLAHAWNIFGGPSDSQPAAPAAASAAPAYEMLPITSDAARAAATALAEDRAHLLAAQGVMVPAGSTTALLSEPGALGLYEDGSLVGCLALRTSPDMRHWGADGRDPGTLVLLDPATVGTTQVGRLLTMWLADHAARRRLTWVWCDVPAPRGQAEEASEWLLDHLHELGWETRSPTVLTSAGDRVVRLRLRAEARAALAAAISVPHTSVPTAVPPS
ncbi:hypothetical protein ABZ501_27280 [Streptomyces sp. NPDC019922]|uniref:hypothetical protein n=1 Tax=Streptomyces TaxID=1883 RepID=UPI001F1D2C6E|nr:hypothetical protein [Streptomyces sp. SID7834]